MTLTLESVTKHVDGVIHMQPTALTLEKGTMNVLLGPTAAGKTTLMRLMAGLDHPSTGRILWNGDDVTGQRVQDRQVAMVYQQFINYPSMSVYENIASPLRLTGLNKGEIDARVRETAGLLQIDTMLDRRPLELSGGQQQRCALARALVKEAGLVLLDEPLANLDYKLREELRAEIPKIFARSGAIFVYATTEPEEALLLGGNCATLWQGRVTQFGPTLQVYRRPADAVTARVFSDPPMNFLEIEKRGEDLVYGHQRLMSSKYLAAELDDGNYVAGFRANHLSLDRPAEGAITFGTTLVATEITGAETFVHVDHDDEGWVGLIHGVRMLDPGEPLHVHLDPAHVYIFDATGALVRAAPYSEAA